MEQTLQADPSELHEDILIIKLLPGVWDKGIHFIQMDILDTPDNNLNTACKHNKYLHSLLSGRCKGQLLLSLKRCLKLFHMNNTEMCNFTSNSKIHLSYFHTLQSFNFEKTFAPKFQKWNAVTNNQVISVQIFHSSMH